MRLLPVGSVSSDMHDEDLIPYLRKSPDGAQQLGAVADSGASVGQICGELGRLAEVVLLVVWRFVFNT